MSDVLRALQRALRSQLQPMLLLLTVLPFVAGGVLAWGFLAWGWDPIRETMQAWIRGTGWIALIDTWLSTFGLSASTILIPVVAIALFLPLAILLALVLSTVIAMPLVVKRVAGEYGDVERKRGGSWLGSVINSLWVTAVVLIGWLVSLPLYLIPPLALIIPWLWWTFAFNRILRYDSLVEHASVEERATLIRTHRGGFFILAGILSLMNWIPFSWFALPVFSGIAFTHYCLQALRDLRSASPTGTST